MRKSNEELWRGIQYPFNVDTPMTTLLAAYAEAIRADEAEHAKEEQRRDIHERETRVGYR